MIDSSALIAILEHEPERQSFFRAIAESDRRLVSAVALQEAGQVAFSRRGAQGLFDLEEFLTLIGAEIVPHDAELARLAIETFKRFGKAFIRKRA